MTARTGGLDERLARIAAVEGLPDDYLRINAPFIKALAGRIARAAAAKSSPLLVGVCGPQGSGKSTLARFVSAALQAQSLSVAAFSLDDLYLTRPEREALAREVHPLLLTRGPPGTHDVTLGLDLIHRLRSADPDTRTAIPRFDKALDTRAPEQAWRTVEGRPDVILFEGWCVGARPESEAALMRPVNSLEATEDVDQVWRRYVNAALAGPYRALFDPIDLLIYLRIPDFGLIYRWRGLQERKLGGASPAERALSLLDEAALARFIAHYERITRALMRDGPGFADIVLDIGEDHAIRCLHDNAPDQERPSA